MQPSSEISGQHTLTLTVVSGPQAGRSIVFDQGRITVGRDETNDFVLNDRYVSNRHGEFLRSIEGYEYQDLRSRHGSLVSMDSQSIRLHRGAESRPVTLADGAEVQLGSSVLRATIREKKQEPPTPEVHVSADGRDQYITSIHAPVAALTRRFTNKDHRLQSLFRLAGKLNGLSRLEDVVDLVVDETFKLFPTVNHFSISLLDDESELKPWFTRLRHPEEHDSAPILSKSIINRVVETQESVLFLRDEHGHDLSKSIIDAHITAVLCAPLVGQESLLGTVQIDTRARGRMFSTEDLDLFSVLASNIAFAIERAQLTENIYDMFEKFVYASVTAVDARDETTAGHSVRVAEYSVALAKSVSDRSYGDVADITFSHDQVRELRYAAMLHDFGKLAVREATLFKPSRLDEATKNYIHDRFERFKALQWQVIAREVLGAKTPSPDALVEIEVRHQAFAEQVDASLAFINRVRQVRFLDDDSRARLDRLAQQVFVAPSGERLPWLLPHEHEDLGVRFGMLNPKEWAEMQSHAAYSEKYLEQIPWSKDLKMIPCIAGAHHEKLDGSGYPNKLSGDEILPQVRILTIADIFDAVTAHDRPYRRACTLEEASALLTKEAEGGKLDQGLVKHFVHDVIPIIKPIVPNKE